MTPAQTFATPPIWPQLRPRPLPHPERLTILAASAAFAIGHPLHGLFFQNQNTKFLHGLAQALPERLGNDWTAGTIDGLRVFSGLVYVIARTATPAAFYGLELALRL